MNELTVPAPRKLWVRLLLSNANNLDLEFLIDRSEHERVPRCTQKALLPEIERHVIPVG